MREPSPYGFPVGPLTVSFGLGLAITCIMITVWSWFVNCYFVYYAF